MKTRTNRKNLPDDVRNEDPGAGEQAGEAVGGIGGTVAGAAIGSLAGPIGTVLGGIAGAVGGWWAGEKAGRAAEDMDEHEPYYRRHWQENRQPGVAWEDARVGYGIGHMAGRNPDYAGKPWADVEPDLRRGWRWEGREFDPFRSYVRTGYERTAKR